MLHRSKCFSWLVAGLLLAPPAMLARADDPPAAQPVTAPAVRHRPHKKKDPPPLVLPPLPAGPLQQVPLPQLPESAPQVTYQNGLLTILAQNATLGEILKQVKKLTGASIDLPVNGAPERVVTEIGPGAPRDVLAVLLNGSQFNYVMLGSTSNPSAIESILLTPKPGSGDGQSAAGGFQQNAQAMNPAVPQPVQPFRQQMIASAPPQPEADADSDDNNTGDEADDSNADDSDQAQPAQPGVAQPGINNPLGQPGDPNQPNAGPKTPEQLLQMMRQGQQPNMEPPGRIPAPTPPPQQ
jgi:hypothetical protein